MISESICPADTMDLPSLLEIYNHYATTTHHTFDTEASSPDKFRNWFGQFSTTGPHRLLVAESGGAILGYANSRSFHPKPVYAQTVETGIFIKQGHKAAGIGMRLYQALLEILFAETDVHQIVASVTLPNEASLRLHSKLGFREVGTFPEIGFKEGQHWDLCWLIRPAHEST